MVALTNSHYVMSEVTVDVSFPFLLASVAIRLISEPYCAQFYNIPRRIKDYEGEHHANQK